MSSGTLVALGAGVSISNEDRDTLVTLRALVRLYCRAEENDSPS